MEHTYNGLPIQLPAQDGRYALVQVETMKRNSGQYTCLPSYPLTIPGRRERRRGFLGAMNDTRWTACGVVEVYTTAAGNRRVRQLDDDVLAADVGTVPS